MTMFGCRIRSSPGTDKKRIPNRLGRNASPDQIHSLVARVVVGSSSEHVQHFTSGAIVDFSAHPSLSDPGRQLLISPPGPVNLIVAACGGGVLEVVMQKSKGQRAQDRFRMLPADELQCPPA